MGSTASPTLNPIAAELEGGGSPPATVLLRRIRQRRQVQGMIAASYFVDGLILLLYVHAGTIPLAIAPAFAGAGLLNVLFHLVLSEIGFFDRHKGHYFVVPQLFINLGIILAFTYIAPEVGALFLCTLFVVFNFGSLRTTVWQTATLWTVTAGGLAALFLLTDKPIGLPHGNPTERLATMLMFAFTIGRCMFLGLFSNAMRQSLYQSGQ